MPINFKFPLNNSEAGYFDTNKTTKDAVKENVKLTILTNQGERIISNVGSKYSLDFYENSKEEIDENIKQHTKEIFQNFFQYLKLDEIKIIHSEDDKRVPEGNVLIGMKYSFNGVDDFTDEITILI